MTPHPKESGTSGNSAAEQEDGQGKGKGIASSQNAAEKQHDADSVMSRLGRSATELSKSVLGGAPATDALNNLASSGKSGSSSSSHHPQTWAENSFASSGSGLASASGGGGGGASFRSTQTSTHIAAEEEAFSNFLDNTSVLAQTEPVGLGESPYGATSTGSKPTTHGQASSVVPSSLVEQQERDGIEVVRLLSQADDELAAYDGNITISQPEMENLRRALFETGTAQISASDWNNLLNFVPDFLRDEPQSLESSYMQLGTVDVSQAGQQWLEEWNRVLTGYTDEVWGDLGDLVQEARREVEQMKNPQQEKPIPDAQALQRLRTVLTRVRARL